MLAGWMGDVCVFYGIGAWGGRGRVPFNPNFFAGLAIFLDMDRNRVFKRTHECRDDESFGPLSLVGRS